jgi:hypothetical protein
MSELSLFRLYLLRTGYAVIAIGLAVLIGMDLLRPAANSSHMRNVVLSVLSAVCLLAVMGIRYPLKMLPVLLFELLWKTIWILRFGLPAWLSHQLTPATKGTLSDCVFGVVLVLIVTPWGYAFKHYLQVPGERWTKHARV